MRPGGSLPTSEAFYCQVRPGRVSSVDKTAHTAQVQFTEGDGFVSFDLQVLVTRPGDYSLPAKDTPVLCLLPEGRLGVGYVLGAIYTENDKPPLDNADKRSIVSDDLRLGAADASVKAAMADLVNDRLKKIQQKFDAHTHVVAGTCPALGGPLSAGIANAPASPIGALADVDAQKVSIK